MRKFIKATLLSILALVSASSFAGTYDSSYYTDQQRLFMVDSYLKDLNSLITSSTTVNSYGTTTTTTIAESIVKYSDTRLLNGKKGYIGSVVLTLKDSYINSQGFSGDFAKQTLIHIFDNSVVGSKSVTDPTADCRSFVNPTRTSCFGDIANKQPGLVIMTEIKQKNPYKNSTISTQYKNMGNLTDRWYTYYNNIGGTTTSRMSINQLGSMFSDTTIENGLVYNALQNADGTWPTRVVETPPMDIGAVIPTPLPIVVAPVVVQDCSNPDYKNKTSASICLVGQIIEGCKLTTDNYQAFINTVAGNVGMTSVDLKITCSTGVNYHLKPIHDMISIQGTQETLKLTGWKDSGRGDKLTPLSAKVMTGNGNEQSIPIYFTLEGKGPSGTYGNSLINKFVGTAVYPIEISY